MKTTFAVCVWVFVNALEHPVRGSLNPETIQVTVAVAQSMSFVADINETLGKTGDSMLQPLPGGVSVISLGLCMM